MLDVLLIPAILLAVFGLRAVQRGDHRLHSYVMSAAFTTVGLRILLWPRTFPIHLIEVVLALFGLVGMTMFLGRAALAWREGRNQSSQVPRIHRALGRLTLLSFALALAVWLLRNRG